MIEPHHCPPPHGYVVAGVGMLAWIIQALPVDPSSFAAVKDLGTTTLLAIAVVFLWRKADEQRRESTLQLREQREEFIAQVHEKEEDMRKKDAMAMELYKSIVETVTAYRVVAEKMSGTLEKMQDTVDNLSTVRAVINKAPGG